MALLTVAPIAAAQETRATISGVVLDPSGAAIPNVRITLTEIRTAVKASATSDSVGNYIIPFLPPGEYEIQAEVAGFQSLVRKGIRLAPSDHPVLDLKMEIVRFEGQATQFPDLQKNQRLGTRKFRRYVACPPNCPMENRWWRC